MNVDVFSLLAVADVGGVAEQLWLCSAAIVVGRGRKRHLCCASASLNANFTLTITCQGSCQWEKKNWTQRHTCVLLFIQTLCKPGNNRLPCQLSGKPSTRGRKTPVACFCFFKCKLYQLPCQATVCCHGRKESHQRKKNILDSVSKGSTQNPTFR